MGILNLGSCQPSTGEDVVYNEDVANAVRHAFGELNVDAVERKMFGGLAFMVAGHMTVGVLGDELMIRVGKDGHDDALAQPHTREMDFTGKPMTGMVYVAEGGLRDDGDLRAWVQRGLDYTSTLPPK